MVMITCRAILLNHLPTMQSLLNVLLYLFLYPLWTDLETVWVHSVQMFTFSVTHFPFAPIGSITSVYFMYNFSFLTSQKTLRLHSKINRIFMLKEII